MGYERRYTTSGRRAADSPFPGWMSPDLHCKVDDGSFSKRVARGRVWAPREGCVLIETYTRAHSLGAAGWPLLGHGPSQVGGDLAVALRGIVAWLGFRQDVPALPGR